MLADAISNPATRIERVLTLVASVYDVSYRDLAYRRSKRLTVPRDVAIYLSHIVLAMSFSKLGAAFHRHPTTAHYAVRRVEAKRDDDSKLDQTLSWLEAVLRNEKEHDK